MSRLSWYQRIYWSYFSNPAEERPLCKYVLNHPLTSILEIGVGDGQRMRRLARLAGHPDGEAVRYIGTDEFESASDGQRHLTLKQAHQVAAQLGFKASLIPGNAQAAIPRVAHKFGASDLIIINGNFDIAHPTAGPVGNWINRLAHQSSVVFACANPGEAPQLVDSQQLELQISKRAA